MLGDDQPVILEPAIGGAGGVDVDVRLRRELAHAGQPLARAELACRDHRPQLHASWTAGERSLSRSTSMAAVWPTVPSSHTVTPAAGTVNRHARVERRPARGALLASAADANLPRDARRDRRPRPRGGAERVLRDDRGARRRGDEPLPRPQRRGQPAALRRPPAGPVPDHGADGRARRGARGDLPLPYQEPRLPIADRYQPRRGLARPALRDLLDRRRRGSRCARVRDPRGRRRGGRARCR